MSWREFRIVKSKKTQVWKIKAEGGKLITEHGQLDGKFQQFADVPPSKGKENTKAFVSAEENLLFHVEREIRKKTEKGYIEYIDGKPVAEQVTEIVWDKLLPKNFCPYKPKTMPDSLDFLDKLCKQKLARFSRKFDGMAHLFAHHPAGWQVYTRRIDIATEKFPKHIEYLETLDQFGPGTLLVGELICSEDQKDNFRAVSRFCRSLPEEARELVEKKEVCEPTFLIFDCLFHNKIDLKDQTYDQRSKLWKDLTGDLVRSVDYFDLTPDNWEKTAKENGWEGFVVTDGSSIPGDKFYAFDGEPERPKGHWKLKPLWEADVVVYAVSYGTGKRLGKIGAAHIKQRYPKFYPGTEIVHPKAGQWFACGKVGSGFTEEMEEELNKLCVKNNIPFLNKDKEAESLDLNKEGIVVQIEYSERLPESQAFRFPVICRIRNDKGYQECYAERLAAEEKE